MTTYVIQTVSYGPGGQKIVKTRTTTDPRDLNGPVSPLDPDPGSFPGSKRYSSGWKQPGPARKPAGSSTILEGKTYDEVKAQCLREGVLFEDPDFPAEHSSVFYSSKINKVPPFIWKRPTELVPAPEFPKFIADGVSRFDVVQGEMGDCWLIAAVASLSQFPKLFARVVPDGQNFKDGYCGIFRFKFWRFGKWEEVFIDDRLPTIRGVTPPVMMHSRDNKEFWSSLLEKAYAKLHGSYEALDAGNALEAMEDFTGGVTEVFDLTINTPPNLFKIMQKAFERESMMGCSINASDEVREKKLDNGLFMGHAYSVTGVKLIEVRTSREVGDIQLVRVRNPWGNEKEWNGPWSDDSPEWKFVTNQAQREIDLKFKKDGEFWMSYKDFITNFERFEICNLSADSLSDDEIASQKKRRWECVTKQGSWIRRVNAGGCMDLQEKLSETFYTNPQYRFDVIDPDEDDDEHSGTVLLALTQVGRRKRKKEGVQSLSIGYLIYELPRNAGSGPLDQNFFLYNGSVAKSDAGDKKHAFGYSREMCSRHKLKPGQYLVVVCTFRPDSEGEFMLRIFSEKPITAAELDEETGIGETDNGVKRPNEPAKPVPVVTPVVTTADTDAEGKAREAFKRIAGEDLEIDAYELRDILNATCRQELNSEQFSSDTCRSLVAMKDCDRSGKLGYEEFKKLWNDLRTWKAAFKKYDTDNSGNFNSHELRSSLRDIGITLSNQTFNSLVQRYCHKDGKMYFDDYIHCIARLTTVFDIFKDTSRGQAVAGFTLDQFVQTTMYS